MPQNRFAEVSSENDLLNYGPERIVVERELARFNKQNVHEVVEKLNQKIKSIQDYLKKVKLLDKQFPPELDLSFTLKPCDNLEALQKQLNSEIINTYNALLCQKKPVELKYHTNVFFTRPTSDSTFYRKAYIQYLSDNLDLFRENNAQKNIKILFNLGRKVLLKDGRYYTGYELFREALREEFRSNEFQRGVFFDSIQLYKTNEDVSKKPILCLLGPSGGGKSFSRDAFFKKYYPEGEQNHLLVISADNAIARQNFKMLSITKQVMEAAGIQLKDLDGISKDVYKDTKERLSKWAISFNQNEVSDRSLQVGLFIPETFANISVQSTSSISIFKPTPQQNVLLQKIGLTLDDIRNNLFYLGKITHTQPNIFKSIVKIMAERRASPSASDIQDMMKQQTPFNFHATGLKEYKKYPISPSFYEMFSWSPSFSRGMKKAQEITKVFKKSDLPVQYVEIENDLILVKKQNNEWLPCTEKETYQYSKKHLNHDKDTDYQILSRDLWKEWTAQSDNSGADLVKFIQENRDRYIPKILTNYGPIQPDIAGRRPLFQNTRYVSEEEAVEKTNIDDVLKNVSDDGVLILALFCVNHPSIKPILPKFYALAMENKAFLMTLEKTPSATDSNALKTDLDAKDPNLVKVLEYVKFF